MTKNDLRIFYKDIRERIVDKEYKSKIISLTVFEYVKQYKSVGVYASMIDEVNTDGLINKMLESGINVFLPKTMDDGLHFYQIHSLNDLNEIGRYEIREPHAIYPLKSPLEAIIVPGICFDTEKNRIGHGMGYFDKYLCDKNILKIGVCFDELIPYHGSPAACSKPDHGISSPGIFPS